jgi:hypothetical protein
MSKINNQRAAFEAWYEKEMATRIMESGTFLKGLIEESWQAAIAQDRQSLGESVDPHSEWTDYAKRSGLLNDDGIACEPGRAQTAWNAFSFAWNRSYRVNVAPQPSNPTIKESLTVVEPVKELSDG